jgi:hypothetical protein
VEAYCPEKMFWEKFFWNVRRALRIGWAKQAHTPSHNTEVSALVGLIKS